MKLLPFLVTLLSPALLTAGDLRFGFATHFEQGWNPSFMPLVAATGVGYIRDDLLTSHWEPTPGNYVTPAFDKTWLDAAHANGLKVVGIIGGSTLYPGGEFDPTPIAARAVYIAQSGLVDVIEVLNEPNNIATFRGVIAGGSTANLDPLVTLTNAVRTAVHSAAPNIPVIGFGEQGSDVLYMMSHGAAADGVVYHPYDTGNTTPASDQPDTTYEPPSLLYTAWIASINAATSMPLWETEWGAPTINGLTEDQQADYLVRRMLRSAGLAVDHSFIYEFKDNNSTDLFGVYNQAGTIAKASYAIVTRTIGALVGVTGQPSSTVTISNIANNNSTDATAQAFQGSTKTVVAYWFANHSPAVPPASSTVSLNFTVPHSHQNSVMLNPFTGVSTPLSTFKNCTSGGTNYFISGLPISDHPMLLIMQ